MNAEPRLVKPKEDPKAGFVYFMVPDGGTRRVKIGWAKSPEERRRKLQAGSSHYLMILRTLPGTVLDEHAFHRRFRQHLIRGEWFHLRGDLDEFVYEEIRRDHARRAAGKKP